MLTPLDYARRYQSLEVGIAGGPSIAGIQIRKYHLGGADGAKDTLVAALDQLFHTLSRKKEKLQLRVNATVVAFASRQELNRVLVAPFVGKGSPEDCQAVLQIAAQLKQAPSNQSGLQTYADAHLGLDCNGFVGSYLWHEYKGNPWPQSAPEGNSYSPSSTINIIMRSGKEIKSPAEMRPERMYLLAQVDDNFRIIPGGGSNPGHIAITERYQTSSGIAGHREFNADMAKKEGVAGYPAYVVVESAGGLGLTSSVYLFKLLRDHKGAVVNGVFRVFRGSRNAVLNFRVAEVFSFRPR